MLVSHNEVDYPTILGEGFNFNKNLAKDKLAVLMEREVVVLDRQMSCPPHTKPVRCDTRLSVPSALAFVLMPQLFWARERLKSLN